MDDEKAYAQAMLQHTEQVLKMFAGERLINKVFAKVFQSHAMGRLVIAYFDWKAGVGAPPTLARLQAETGCRRTLAAFVGIAKVARVVTSEPHPSDRRNKVLVPGQRVVQGLRDWLHHHLTLAEVIQLMPVGCADALREDDRYFERFVRASIVVIEGMPQIRQRFPLWDWFERHECGLRIAYALLQSHYKLNLQLGNSIHQPVELDVSGAGVAHLLGLSKSHVRNVLNGAEQLGILTHDESRRSLRLSIAFLDEARESFVAILSLMALAHDRSQQIDSCRRNYLPMGLCLGSGRID
jgi:hypothetical protein